MARLQQDMVQGCNEEAGEVTGWPIDQIQAAVAPDQRQSQMRDDLGNAIVKASDQIRSHCQSNVAFTPTGRLSQMHDRLGALVDAVNTVNPPLSAFYDSLSDEQKARFDHIAPRAPPHGQAAQGDLTTATIRGQCNAGMMAWPTDQIDRVVRPAEAQRAKLQGLAVGRCASRRDDQGRMPGRRATDATGAAGDGRPALGGHAARRRDNAAGACRFLQFAQRRSEGALQLHGPAIVRAKRIIAFVITGSRVSRRSAAPQIRDRFKLRVRNSPGSAAHHFTPRGARDKNSIKQRGKFRP